METIQAGFDFGMIGLGTMGRNLLLNMSEHGIKGAGYDKDTTKIPLLEQEDKERNTKGFDDISTFIKSIKPPRAIMMLVPAGKIVDDVLEELIPLLDKGDILIDGGNSYFQDTRRRDIYLQSKGLHFFGMGISGGEEGARYGPSMMPGGDKTAYEVMKPILEAIAAKVDDEACVTYIGPEASGHFVKTVHNGIEYGLMQLITETYEYLKYFLKLDNAAIAAIFEKWNDGKLQSFLIEITSEIFTYKDKGENHILLDDIKDEAKAKGTGKWTSQIAMDLDVPVPTIDTAVAMRNLSIYKSLRTLLGDKYKTEVHPQKTEDIDQQIKSLEDAFYFAMISTYAQGMHLLSKASEAYKYNLNIADIARIWRGGCIIRSEFLNTIYKAYSDDKELVHLFMNTGVESALKETESGIRSILQTAMANGLGMPAFAASLGYFDSLKKASSGSNLIQAQRDFFGAHQYEKINASGVFHTQWTGIKSAK
jgi:6-phosphogluconate dehydrogenase